MATPEIGSAPPGAGETGTPEQGRKPGAEQRISQLVAEKNSFRDKWQQVQSRLDSLETRQAPAEPADPMKPASFADLDDGILKQQYAEAVRNQEGETAAELMTEMARRFGQHSGQRTADELRKEHVMSQHAQKIQAELQTRFADVAGDPDSEVYRKADQIAAYFVSVHGQNAIREKPELALLSFALASLDVNGASNAEEIERLKNENARLKEASGLEGSLRAASRLNDESRSALANGDIKGAFRNLGIVRSLEG